MFAFRNQFHGYCQPPNVEIEIESLFQPQNFN